MDRTTLINTWKSEVNKNYGTAKFSASNREEVLGILFDLLLEFNVDIEDAKYLKSDVEKFMTTEEGRKGKGSYKGWTDNVKMDFDAALTDYYRSHKNSKEQRIVKDYGNYPYMPKNALMTAWAKERFGIGWSEELNLQVHTHGNRFNLEFQKDVMDSMWAVTGENIPEWAKPHIA